MGAFSIGRYCRVDIVVDQYRYGTPNGVDDAARQCGALLRSGMLVAQLNQRGTAFYGCLAGSDDAIIITFIEADRDQVER